MSLVGSFTAQTPDLTVPKKDSMCLRDDNHFMSLVPLCLEALRSCLEEHYADCAKVLVERATEKLIHSGAREKHCTGITHVRRQHTSLTPRSGVVRCTSTVHNLAPASAVVTARYRCGDACRTAAEKNSSSHNGVSVPHSVVPRRTLASRRSCASRTTMNAAMSDFHPSSKGGFHPRRAKHRENPVPNTEGPTLRRSVLATGAYPSFPQRVVSQQATSTTPNRMRKRGATHMRLARQPTLLTRQAGLRSPRRSPSPVHDVVLSGTLQLNNGLTIGGDPTAVTGQKSATQRSIKPAATDVLLKCNAPISTRSLLYNVPATQNGSEADADIHKETKPVLHLEHSVNNGNDRECVGEAPEEPSPRALTYRVETTLSLPSTTRVQRTQPDQLSASRVAQRRSSSHTSTSKTLGRRRSTLTGVFDWPVRTSHPVLGSPSRRTSPWGRRSTGVKFMERQEDGGSGSVGGISCSSSFIQFSFASLPPPATTCKRVPMRPLGGCCTPRSGRTNRSGVWCSSNRSRAMSVTSTSGLRTHCTTPEREEDLTWRYWHCVFDATLACVQADTDRTEGRPVTPLQKVSYVAPSHAEPDACSCHSIVTRNTNATGCTGTLPEDDIQIGDFLLTVQGYQPRSWNDLQKYLRCLMRAPRPLGVNRTSFSVPTLLSAHDCTTVCGACPSDGENSNALQNEESCYQPIEVVVCALRGARRIYALKYLPLMNHGGCGCHLVNST